MDQFDRDWIEDEVWMGRYCKGILHVVEKGDTLYKISRQYHVPLARILLANPYVDIYNLQVGDEICVPKMRRSKPGMCPTPQREPGKGTEGCMPAENVKDRMPSGSIENRMPSGSIENRMPSGSIENRMPSNQRKDDRKAADIRDVEDQRKESRRPIDRKDAGADRAEVSDDIMEKAPDERLEKRMEEDGMMHGCHYEIE